MAVKEKILTENETKMKEVVRFYGYENLSVKAKFTLARIIFETELAIKQGK